MKGIAKGAKGAKGAKVSGELTWCYEWVKSFSMTFLMVMTSTLGMLLAAIDTHVAGTIGVDAITSVSVGNSIFWLVAVPLIAVLNSMDAFFSRAYGAGDYLAMDSWLIQAFWLSIGLVMLGFPVIILAMYLYKWTNISTQAYAGVVAYLKGLSPSLLLILMSVPLEKYWNCQHRITLWTVLSVVLIPVNFTLDFYLATQRYSGFNWGVYGIGVAKTLCNVFSFLVVALYSCWSWCKERAFLPRVYRPSILKIKRILKFGLPASGQAGTDVLGFSVLNYMAAFFGNVSVSAHQIVFIIDTLFYMMAVRWSNAATIRIGFYIGLKRERFAAKLGACHLGSLLLVFVLLSLFLGLNRSAIFSLFTREPAVTEIGVQLLILCAFIITANAIQCLMGNLLRAWGDTRTAFITNLLAFYGVGFPLAYYLAFSRDMGIIGTWVGLWVIMLLCATCNLFAWFYFVSKYPKSLLQHSA